jgi:AMME syndrome candidate gene 1 protein
LSVCVSLLKNFEEKADHEDWTVGQHGVQIEFEKGNEQYEATFLPEVMVEEKWTKRQTLDELLIKSEYRGKCNYKDLKAKIRLTTYESVKTTISYNDYLLTKPEQER